MKDYFEQIAQNWKPKQPEMEENMTQIIEQTRKRAKALARATFWRDLREITAGLCIAAFFLVFAFYFEGTVSAGALTMALCASGVSLFLGYTRWKQRQEDRQPRHSLKEALEWDLRALQRQYNLLRSVTWWYLAPLAFGMAVFIVSVQISLDQPDYEFVGFYSVVCVLLFATIDYLNRHTARKRFLPEVNAVQDLIRNLEAESELLPNEGK